MTTFPDHAIAKYREAITEFWELAQSFELIMPHPIGFEQPSYTFKQWDAVRDLVTDPATAKRRALEKQYPGIGDEYEERRYQACEAAEARRFEEGYR